MSTQEKQCYYEVLGLTQTCTPDEIRSSYKKLALQRHPDKLIQSGISASDATASFQELQHAYEVLSDPKERSWYDSHRSQILYSSPFGSDSSTTGNGNVNYGFPDLFSYFSASCYTDYKDAEKGFYRVYGDVFDRFFRNEVDYCRKLGLGLVKEAPLMGDLRSDYGQASAFYGYWLGFGTVMDFGWVNKWDAMAGESRKERRLMEEENKKVRKKAKREFNETVRRLAEFVKKRDKRVIEMGVRKEKERERKREEEVKRKKELEREKLERARRYVDPEWARVDEELVFDEVDDEAEEKGEEEKRELYCAACGKKFKSDKQWKNHEQSKKHKDRVAELRRFFKEEDGEFEGVEGEDDVDEGGLEVREDVVVNDEDMDGIVHDGFLSAEEDVDDSGEKHTVEVHSGDEDGKDDLNEKFKECVGLDEGNDKVEVFSDAEDDVGIFEEANGIELPGVGSDEDVSILEAMISERRCGKHVTFKDQSAEKSHFQSDNKVEAMEYNNKKAKKKSRRAKKDKGNANDGSNYTGENSKAPNVSNVTSDGDDDDNHDTRGRGKAGKKGKSKRDAESIPKNSTRGRKQKEKVSDPVCEKCGEEFDSRNQLYKHLSDTGHASLKSR